MAKVYNHQYEVCIYIHRYILFPTRKKEKKKKRLFLFDCAFWRVLDTSREAKLFNSLCLVSIKAIAKAKGYILYNVNMVFWFSFYFFDKMVLGFGHFLSLCRECISYIQLYYLCYNKIEMCTVVYFNSPILIL